MSSSLALALVHPVIPVIAGALLIYVLTLKKWRKAMIAFSEIIQNIGGTLVGGLACLNHHDWIERD
jgi:hypothetical protein